MTTSLVPRELPIVGPADQVRRTLETQRRQGRLVTAPRDIALRRNRDGSVTALVTVLVDERLSFRKAHPVAFRAAIAGGAVLVLLAGGVALAYATLRTLSHALDRPAMLGAVVIAAGLGLAFLSKGKGRDCPGVVVHCRDHKH
jgi:hypothetical protein